MKREVYYVFDFMPMRDAASRAEEQRAGIALEALLHAFRRSRFSEWDRSVGLTKALRSVRVTGEHDPRAVIPRLFEERPDVTARLVEIPVILQSLGLTALFAGKVLERFMVETAATVLDVEVRWENRGVHQQPKDKSRRPHSRGQDVIFSEVAAFYLGLDQRKNLTQIAYAAPKTRDGTPILNEQVVNSKRKARRLLHVAGAIDDPDA